MFERCKHRSHAFTCRVSSVSEPAHNTVLREEHQNTMCVSEINLLYKNFKDKRNCFGNRFCQSPDMKSFLGVGVSGMYSLHLKSS